MELESNDITSRWTLVYYDEEEECLSLIHYESEEALLEDCKSDENLAICLIFKGQQAPFKLTRKLAIAELTDKAETVDSEESTKSKSNKTEPQTFVF